MHLKNDPADLDSMFDQLNTIGTARRTAVVNMSLGNNTQMTIRVGGPGINSWPPTPPFEAYEVLVSGAPPRFWSKYSDSAASMYDRVPKLLICHHIIRSGGMYGMIYESLVRNRSGVMFLKVVVPEGADNRVLDAVKAIEGVRLLSSTFSLDTK
jgi:hypothetical protein